MNKLLRLNVDPSLVYGISIDHLPSLTRKAFLSADRNELASVYRTRIQQTGGQRSHQQGHSRTNTADQAAGSKLSANASPIIMLNMFEYFVFCFGFTLRLAAVDPVNVGAVHKDYPQDSHFPLFTSPSNTSDSDYYYSQSQSQPSRGQMHFARQLPTLDLSYFELVNVYLAYFVPKKPTMALLSLKELESRGSFVTPRKSDAVASRMYPQPSFEAQSGGQARDYCGARANVTGANAMSESVDVFQSSDFESLQKAIRTSEFFFSILVELWICQNESPQQTSGDLKVWSYIKPSLSHIKCVTFLVSHLVSLDLLKVSTEHRSDLSEFRKEDAYGVTKM